MLDRLIYFSIHNKLIIGLLTLALVAWGGYSLLRLPIDAVPDITNNQVVVYTVAPSLAAGDIERLVSFPVEQSVATIPGREEVRSFSRFGLSVVTIVFEDQIDIYWARQQVAERLREAESQIPASIGRPEMAPVSTGLGEIYQYVLRAEPGFEKKYDARELRTMQDWIVRRQLLGTPGVADVSSFGGQLKQFEIRLDPTRLRSLRVTTEQVYQAVARNNQNAGGAYLDQKPTAYFIRTEGLAKNADDLGNIVVRSTAGACPCSYATWPTCAGLGRALRGHDPQQRGGSHRRPRAHAQRGQRQRRHPGRESTHGHRAKVLARGRRHRRVPGPLRPGGPGHQHGEKPT
jgi:cobalt-zinc-cadmium resistance protein CzcA